MSDNFCIHVTISINGGHETWNILTHTATRVTCTGKEILFWKCKALLRICWLFCGDVGLFWGDVGLFCGHMGLIWGDTGLFCGDTGLFCGDIGLFYGDTVLFWRRYKALLRRNGALLRRRSALLRRYQYCARGSKTIRRSGHVPLQLVDATH